MISNPFPTSVPLLYLLKTSGNFRFSDVFRGYRNGTLVENGLIKTKCFLKINIIEFVGKPKDLWKALISLGLPNKISSCRVSGLK